VTVDITPGAILVTGNPLLDISRGLIPGITSIRKFGRNSSVGASEETIWASGGVYPFLTASSIYKAFSSDAADDANGGAGARTLTIEGLGENFKEYTEDIILSGTTASPPTTDSFFRLNRAFVKEVGTIGENNNTGDITIVTDGGATNAFITAGIGQTQILIYTIPAGKTGYLNRFFISAETAKPVDIKFWRRERADDVTIPVTAKRLAEAHDSVQDIVIDQKYIAWPSFPEKTDI